MLAHYFVKYGKDTRGTLAELPTPAVSPSDVLIRVHAASVNPVDFKIRDGELKFVRKDSFPLVLGGDGAGVVTSVGEKVSKFKKGDEVFFRVPKGGQGTFAELVSISECYVARKPPSLSFVEAAALPLVSLTAMQALFDVAQVRPGQKVFIPGGSGGVGSHAIQIAKAMRAFVATTTSTKNLVRVRALGADQVIDYKTTDFRSQLKDYDAVFDTLGGREQVRAFEILKKGGVMVSIVGPPTSSTAKELGLNLFKQLALSLLSLRTRLRARGAGVSYHFLFMKPSGSQLEQLAHWVDEGKVKPILDRTFPFAQTDEALAYVASGRAQGKVVIEIA